MSERTSASELQDTKPVDDRMQTEAEGLVNVLHDLGLPPAIRLGPANRILFELGDGTRPGALDVALLAERQFYDDEEFRDDFVHAVATYGNLYVDAPGINSDLKTADAATLINAVSNAGFPPLVLDWDDEGGLQLVFQHSHREDRDLAAIDLIRLLLKRYRDEPNFKEAVLKHLGSEGPITVFERR